MEEQKKTTKKTIELAVKDFENKMSIFINSDVVLKIKYTFLEIDKNYKTKLSWLDDVEICSCDLIHFFTIDIKNKYTNHKEINIVDIRLVGMEKTPKDHIYICMEVIISGIKNDNERYE